MDAEQVVSKILSEAQVEADKITGKAKDQYAAEQATLNKKLDEYGKGTETLAAEAGTDKKSRMLAGTRMELSKQYLAAKGILLDKVFVKAAQQIKALDDNKYAELMAGLMEKAIETGDEEVIAGKNDSRIDQKLIELVNSKLDSGNLRLSTEKADIDGGFILKRGNVKTNVSIEVLISSARNELEIEIANEMFE